MTEWGAMQAFKEGEVIFREPPLVALQHVLSRSEALVCGNCFRFLGPLELQAAWLLRSDEGIASHIPLDAHMTAWIKIEFE